MELDDSAAKSLSTDQKYMYLITNSIIKGKCSDQVAKLNPGQMAHSRWLTTVNRICRLYLSTANPSDNLVLLMTFIVQVYSPAWFEIKRSCQIQYGPKILFCILAWSRYLESKWRSIVDHLKS